MYNLSHENNEFDDNLIAKLLHITDEKVLNQVLNKLSETVNINNKLLLKMELKRLKKPTAFRIDLRLKFDNCIEYPLNGQNHYLPSFSVNVFKEIIAQYNQHLTIGGVEKFNKIIKEGNTLKKAIAEQKFNSRDYQPYSIEHLFFGNYRTRGEERLFFFSKVLISTPNQQFNGVTSDISVNGIRVVIPDNTNIEKGHVINVEFKGIKSDYIDGVLDNYISYSVVGIEIKTIDGNDKVWIRAVRVSKETQADTFFQKFIQTKKFNSRLNSGDLVPTLLNKGYEHFYMQKALTLPLFFNEKNELAHIIVSDFNRESFNYWKNHDDTYALPTIFNPKFISKLSHSRQCHSESLLYSFSIIHHGVTSFFVATDRELSKSKLFGAFVKFGLSKGTLRVHQFHSAKTSSNFNELGLEFDKLSLLARERIENIGRICVLQDITTKTLISDFTSWHYKPSKEEKKSLLSYRIKNKSSSVDVVPVTFEEKRKETRFAYTMNIEVNNKSRFEVIGHTKNFSINGLYVTLDKPIRAKVKDSVFINIPNELRVKGKEYLSVAYEIISLNKAKTLMRLSMLNSHDKNKAFFRQLVVKNKEEVIPDYGPIHNRGLLDGLCRLYSRHSNLNLLFINKIKGKIQPARLVTCEYETEIKTLLKSCSHDDKNLNIFPIIHSDIESIYSSEKFQKLSESNQPISDEIYISIDKDDGDKQVRLTTRLGSQLTTRKMRIAFLNRARTKGKVFVVLVNLFKTGYLQEKFLDERLALTTKTSQHKVNQASTELKSIIGCLQLTDITISTLKSLQIEY
jgi:hypothetical protein